MASSTAADTAIPVHAQGATVPLFIDGAPVTTERVFAVVNPATGATVHQCSSASAADAQAAVDAAARALPAWRALAPGARRDIFLRAAAIMERRSDELAATMVDELGVPRQWADFNVATARDMLVDVAGRIAALAGFIPTLADPGSGAMVVKEPYGVVLAIAPWNAPYILGTRAVAFPLAAGNTAVFKPSELSPRTMYGICAVLHEAGLPAGALNMVVHAPADAAPITAALIANAHVKKINFTGSTAVGRIVARLAGEQLKPVLLELGGKAPAIVWRDADLALAADQCALGAFLNAGQICMSTERVIVHADVAADFAARLRAAVARLFPDEAVLVHAPAADKNRALLADAVAKGATTTTPSEDKPSEQGGGTRMRPVVVSGVTPHMDLYMTESFGPSVALYTVDSEAAALRLANDTEYGLTAAVFTEDLRRGLRLARGIETGACHINAMTVHDEPALPHGGAKSSGYGRFNAAVGLEEWVRTKTITYKY